jgi:hypothetical protein
MFCFKGIPLIQAGSSNISRQNSKTSAPSSPPVQDNDRSAVNDKYIDDLEAEFDGFDDENTVVMEMKI